MSDTTGAVAGAFRRRLRSGEPLLGTFLKTPSLQLVEVLALAPIDVVCIDQEHAPFGPAELDGCIAMARALGLPTLVRVPGLRGGDIARALDLGASGVIVPHVDTADEAREAVRAATFGPDGGRGYAGSHRAARYATRGIPENLAEAAEGTTVVVQVESAAAVEAAGPIASVPGVDAIFIGPADLAVSMGESSPEAEPVRAAVARAIGAARRAGTVVGAFATSPASMALLRDAGASFVLAGSDQAAVLDGMRRLRADLG